MLPDPFAHLTEYLIAKHAITSGTIFLSYSRKNRETARALYEKLDRMGFKLWRDVHDIEADSDDWWRSIEKAIESCETVILCMSLPALKSSVVSDEWMHARKHQKRVIPVVVDDIWDNPDVNKHGENDKEKFTIPNWMQRRNWMDFRADASENAAAWANLIQTLNTLPQVKRFVSMVGELPPRFVRRPEEIDRAIHALVDDNNDVLAKTIALKGAGGYGKTTLAKAIARDARVQGAFDDGILWVTLGEELLNKHGDELRTALIGRVQELIYTLTNTHPVVETLEMAHSRLQEAIGDLYLLLVIDDVWEESHLKPFLVKTRHAACLITTRSTDTVNQKDIKQHPVDKMKLVEAVELLSAEITCDDMLPYLSELQTLARELREYPLLLGLVNTQITTLMIDTKISLPDALVKARRRLESKGVLGFDDKDTGERTKAVSATLDVSINQLKPEYQLLYKELAIFPKDALIPLSTLERYWGLDEDETEDFCRKTLYRKTALLHSFEGMNVRIHDVFRDYLIRQWSIDQHQNLQRRLVERYGDLRALPDNYAWGNIAYHLLEGGQAHILYTLLTDYNFLHAKLASVDANALIEDCDMYLKSSPIMAEIIQLIRSTLSMSAHILTEDKNALAHQLVGRLMGWCKKYNEIRTLTDHIINHKPGLYPLDLDSDYHVLEHAGGALLRVLSGHTGGVNSVEFSQDGSRIVSASEDCTARVWDARTGIFLFSLEGHEEEVNSAIFSINGEHIVSASNDETIRIWDARSGILLHTLKGHSERVNSAEFSFDGTRIVSASADMIIRVWDAYTGECLSLMGGHEESISSVAFSRDGRRIISASFDKTIRVWDAYTGKQLAILHGHEKPVNSVAFNHDGTRIVSASWDKTVRVWDVETGEQLLELTRHEKPVNNATFSLDGSRIVSASQDKFVRVWNALTGELLHTFTGHEQINNNSKFCSDGTLIASASDDKTVRIWLTDAPPPLPWLKGHNDAVTSVSFSPTGRYIVSVSGDNTICLWDALVGEPILSPVRYKNVKNIELSPDGMYVIYKSIDNISVWDVNTGSQLIEVPNTPEGQEQIVRSFPEFYQTNKTFMHGHTWNVSVNQQKQIIQRFTSPDIVAGCFYADTTIQDYDISPDGLRFVAGDLLGRVIFLRWCE